MGKSSGVFIDVFLTQNDTILALDIKTKRRVQSQNKSKFKGPKWEF